MSGAVSRVSPTARAQKFTLRQYLTYQAVMDGANVFLAVEAVATTAIEHPEWDMDEELTWQEWEDRQ